MNKIIKGKNLEISNSLKIFVEEKIDKALRHFPQAVNVNVELTTEKNPSIKNNQIIEVQITSNGPLIRAKAASIDIHAAVDLVIGKLEKQIERYKGKLYRSQRNHHQEPQELKEVQSPKIAKTKSFPVTSMTPQEAAFNMELLGHDFYVFKNEETDKINIVYMRQNDDIGLIEPL